MKKAVVLAMAMAVPVALWAQEEPPEWNEEEMPQVTRTQLDSIAEQRRQEALRALEYRDTERRLSIMEKEGEAAELAASAMRIKAQADECAARRAAFEAGAAIALCAGDVVDPEDGGEGPGGDEVSSWVQSLSAQISDLEKRIDGINMAPLPAGPVVEEEAEQSPVRMAVADIVLLGPTRVVVRRVDGTGDEVYRVPGEARVVEGDEGARRCVETLERRGTIEQGARLCERENS